MRFVQIQIMRRGKLLGFGQNKIEIHVLLFPNLVSIPFDYPIIAFFQRGYSMVWVKNFKLS